MTPLLRNLLAFGSGVLIGTSLALLLWVVVAGPARSAEQAPAGTPLPCVQPVTPAWCADLPPERVQGQLPEETHGRAYG